MPEPTLGGPQPLNTKFKSVLEKSPYSDQLFWRGFKRSLVAHSALAIALILLSYLSVKETIKFTPSIRVDLVGLPEIKKADIDKMKMDQFDEAPKPKEEVKETTKAKPDSKKEETDFALKKEKLSKKDLKKALDRLKALEAIEEDVKSQPKKSQIKGNILSKGNSLAGDTAQDTNAYIGAMQTKLRENWNLPIWLTRQNYTAQAVIFLDKTGNVTNMIIAKSSGNAQFDDYVLKTIKQSQPFGAPPSEIVGGGIKLGFPL